MLGDFHTHIRRRVGTPLQNALILAHMARHYRFTHLGLGDHRWLCPTDVAREVEQRTGIHVVRMAELDCWEDEHNVDVLALNVPDDPAWRWRRRYTVREAAQRIHDGGGRAVLPHPYRIDDLTRNLEWLDGAEIYNGNAHLTRANGIFPSVASVLFAAGKAHFQNSDFHVWQSPLAAFGVGTWLPDGWFVG